MEMKMQRCTCCNKATLHTVEGCNHVLHLLLTFFTGGLWLIPWIIVAICSGKANCTECGKEN